MVLLGQGDLEHTLAGGNSFNAPYGVALFNLLVKIAIDHQGLSLDTDLQVLLLDIYCQLLGGGALGDGYVHCDFLQSLLPVVLVGTATVS